MEALFVVLIALQIAILWKMCNPSPVHVTVVLVRRQEHEEGEEWKDRYNDD